MKKSILNWAVRLIVSLLILGIPFFALGGASLLKGAKDSSGEVENVDKAFVSGEYVIFINETFHTDSMNALGSFFAGEGVPAPNDDISCFVSVSDPGAAEYAELCRSRLRENQMKIRYINPLLLLSKGDGGYFDVIIMSREFYDNFSAESIAKNENITEVKKT